MKFYIKQIHSERVFIYECNGETWRRLKTKTDVTGSTPFNWNAVINFCQEDNSKYCKWQVLTEREAFLEML